MFLEFLKELRNKGIEVYFHDGKLRYRGPQKNITSDILFKLEESKNELIKYFWPPECSDLIVINAEGSKTPLVLVDNVGFAHQLGKNMGSDQPLYVFYEDIWKDGKKHKHNSINALSGKYISQVEKILGTDPVILGGYCFGGLVAYEMACQLRKKGREIPLVILFNTQNPIPGKELINSSFIRRMVHGFSNLVKKIAEFFRRPINNSYSLLKRVFRYIIGGLLLPFTSVPRFLIRHYHIYHKSVLISKYKPSRTDCNILLFRAVVNNSSQISDMGWGELVPSLKVIDLNRSHTEIATDEEINHFMVKVIREYIGSIENL